MAIYIKHKKESRSIARNQEVVEMEEERMIRLKGLMKRVGVAVMVVALVFGMTPIYTAPVAKAEEDLSNKYIDENGQPKDIPSDIIPIVLPTR